MMVSEEVDDQLKKENLRKLHFENEALKKRIKTIVDKLAEYESYIKMMTTEFNETLQFQKQAQNKLLEYDNFDKKVLNDDPKMSPEEFMQI